MVSNVSIANPQHSPVVMPELAGFIDDVVRFHDAATPAVMHQGRISHIEIRLYRKKVKVIHHIYVTLKHGGSKMYYVHNDDILSTRF